MEQNITFSITGSELVISEVDMGSKANSLHIFFFPFMAHGHTIPVVEMAKLFAARGLKATIVTTPVTASYLSKTIQRSKHLGLEIEVQVIRFPSLEVGLPEGFEHADLIGTDMEMSNKFFQGLSMLKEPFEELLEEFHPDCLVSDVFLPWTADAAAKFGIPRLIFHGRSFFSSCAQACFTEYGPQVSSLDAELFILPNLPGDITFTRKQLLPQLPTDHQENDTPFIRVFKEAVEAEEKSYGAVFNSFYELESEYADYYRKSLGRKAWHVGPVSLCNKDVKDKVGRGKDASINEHDCLKWLSSKKPNSVVYLCFGSLVKFSPAQLQEIAEGLDKSGQQFLWVVATSEQGQEDEKDWLPEEFQKRIEGKGLIIRGWAPQVLILEHEAIGGFVTHCGWNSTLEGISAGLPMVTWPVFAEQFYNEKLVTQALKIGVPLGAREFWDSIGSEAIEKAVTLIMDDEEAADMRKRAKALGKMATKAVEEGGSSYSDLNALIEELSLLRR